MGKRFFSMLAVLVSLQGCQQSGRLTDFQITPLPESVKAYHWIKLAEDRASDGRRPNLADGKALYYFHDASTGLLWFKITLYTPVNPTKPAVSVAIDIDANQETGMSWYGANSNFQFDRMLSVGPISKEGETYTGYNGITDVPGVQSRDWTNLKQGGIVFHVDA